MMVLLIDTHYCIAVDSPIAIQRPSPQWTRFGPAHLLLPNLGLSGSCITASIHNPTRMPWLLRLRCYASRQIKVSLHNDRVWPHC